jgi:hypothetical protein
MYKESERYARLRENRIWQLLRYGHIFTSFIIRCFLQEKMMCTPTNVT